MIQSATAENIKQIMKRRGLKQRAVAERAGFSIQQFSDLLHGRKVMKDVYVAAIARALEVTPNELFGVRTGTWMRKEETVHMKQDQNDQDLETAKAAELFLMLSEGEQEEILGLLRSLLSERQKEEDLGI